MTCFFSSYGQVDTIEIRYFETGELSSLITMNKNKRGTAKAYNKKGDEIYSRIIRNVAGSASVRFKYYGTGAIKKAVYYSAPDGGIQWQRVTSYFNVQGKLLQEIKEGHDSVMEVFSHHREQVFCKPVHNNEIVVINNTDQKLYFILDDKTTDSILVEKGDSVLAQKYISAEISQPPQHFYTIKVRPYKKRVWLFFKNKKEVVTRRKKESLQTGKTRYTFYLESK